jgi:alanine racemase
MHIDLDALDPNLALVRRLAGPGIAVIASVKANAYGHGIVPVALPLEVAGVEVLATARSRTRFLCAMLGSHRRS